MHTEKFIIDLKGEKTFSIPEEPGCIVQYTLSVLKEYRKECCGKCIYCREGLCQTEEIYQDMALKKSKTEDGETLEKIAECMSKYSSCDLGCAAGAFLKMITSQYKEELEQHLRKKKCPKGQCKAYEIYYVDPGLCTGCGECLDVCPMGCIDGKKKYIAMIDEYDCTRCGLCQKICEEGAIKKTSGTLPKLPEKLTKAGKFKNR